MRMRRLAAPILLSFFCLIPCANADIVKVDVNTRLIENFKVGSDEDVFGHLQFLGGLELSSDNDLLGAMSAIRLTADRSTFIGVADTGHWYGGNIKRDDNGRLSGIASFEIAPMLNEEGKYSTAKWNLDAEGLVIKDEYIYVSFERNSRIEGYKLANPMQSAAVKSLPVQIPKREFRRNGGLEAIAKSQVDSPLEGAIVAFSERSVNTEGDLFAAIIDGTEPGVFFVKRNPPYNITDADFLPNGDLLLLERRFSIARGIGMRIRRIDVSTIKKDATVDGDILIDVGSGYQIDNMEGMSVTTNDQGEVFITLISDDNHSFLQRNLMLEFKLLQQ
ncbi:esterase-like activity of phytase family protein [Lentilitoribacter sp. Alg239-R112]|uniref:esterase-like activity of phytase family protein n=1 Tax=Lentilitoribacter sp. Alg239-R112 TaxID=2305987 RepID=UPI0013A695C8|nr:esterase-like activity of phytase family protein [Lentilitoribacter sp. Alg239-R112]